MCPAAAYLALEYANLASRMYMHFVARFRQKEQGRTLERCLSTEHRQNLGEDSIIHTLSNVVALAIRS